MSLASPLMCVFSFNMGQTLANCIASMERFCPQLDAILIDDASTDPDTLEIIDAHRSRFAHVHTNKSDKTGKKHGNLYENIQYAVDFAINNGYEYLFLIQDDMQFVRHYDSDVRAQYAELFSDQSTLQVDPRFLRRGTGIEIVPEKRAYRNSPTMSYADVGLLHLNRLHQTGWRFVDGERLNRDGLAAMGLRRLYPFTPILTHVPFPRTYRRGRLRSSNWILRRGSYGFHDMTDTEIARMDSRPLEHPPFFRDFLRPTGMVLTRLVYSLTSDRRVFM